MAAISTDRLLSPRAGSTAAGLSLTPPVTRRRSIGVAETLTRIWSATREGMLLLWMLIIAGFFFLIGAGAVGLLG